MNYLERIALKAHLAHRDIRETARLFKVSPIALRRAMWSALEKCPAAAAV